MKSVADLLAAQPYEELVAMEEGIVERIGQLEVELAMVRTAKGRKRPSRSQKAAVGKALSGVRREDLLPILASIGPATPPQVKDALTMRGFTITTNAVRNHLVRLVEDKKISRTQDGRYAVAGSSENGHRGPVASGHIDQAQLRTG